LVFQKPVGKNDDLSENLGDIIRGETTYWDEKKLKGALATCREK
jgi:hypothetical protein